MLNKIKPLYFFLSFAIGLLIVYVMTPPPQVVMKFPSPFNAGSIKYRDKSDTCFVYKADKASCPRDQTLIREQPITM